jgi:glycosyltransferase involved in cell wall biosynthesis
MNVLHVLTEPRGGGGAYALSLTRAQRERGDAVRFLSPLAPAPGEDVIRLGYSNLRAAAAACRAAHVVHLHGVRSGLLRPLIGGTSALLTTNGLHKLRSARRLELPLVRAASRFALGAADAIVCTSEAEYVEVGALGPALARRARVVLNGVAPAPLPSRTDRIAARRKLGLDEDAPVLVFVGGLRYQKNPELAVDAARLARRQLPGLVLLVAGEGPLEAELRRMDGDWLQLLGPRSDVPDLLAAADALLHTSRWEGLSLAVLEGLWRGRPAVVTDAPGNPEAVGEAGFVAAQDARAVADAILRLFTTEGLLAHLGRLARSRAEALFDEQRMVEETFAVYDEVIRQTRR